MSEGTGTRREKIPVSTIIWALLTALIFSAAVYLGES
jgi:hypothetical protein